MLLKWRGKEVKAATREGVADALHRGTEHLLGKSNETVPYEEGTLQASGHTDVDVEDGLGVVSYDTPYAVRLHENPQFNFQHGRRGKWLQLTFQEEQREVGRIMEHAVRGGFPKT